MEWTVQHLLTRNGWVKDKQITVKDGIITRIGASNSYAQSIPYIVPGMTDEHLHGGFGCDLMRGNVSVWLDWLRHLANRGTTHVLAGIYTDDLHTMRSALSVAREVTVLQAHGEGGAKLEGVHLEGPYISPNALGAMNPAHIRLPSVKDWKLLSDGFSDLIKLVTLAPELPGAESLISFLVSQGILLLAGHTNCNYTTAERAFSQGIGGVCHFYNACTPIHHREPGLLTAAMLSPTIYCECICDMIHVHPAAIKLLYAVKGASRIIVVSDAVSTTGLPDGQYLDNGVSIAVHNGESRTADGSLNGGGATQLEEVRKLIANGISSADAFSTACFTPADFLHLPNPELSIGQQADFVALSNTFMPLFIVCGKSLLGLSK